MVIIFSGICIVRLLDYGFDRVLALGTKEMFVIVSSQLFLGKTTKARASTADKISVIEEEEI